MTIKQLVEQFNLEGKIVKTEEKHTGNINRTYIITIEQNGNEKIIENIKEIKDIVYILSEPERKTRTQSIQDFPTNVEDVISVHFNCGEILTLYVYEKNNEYFIEQAYNGIYRISADEYNSIEKYIRNVSND